MTDELVERLCAGCPSGALRREGRELLLDLGRCTGCGRCVQDGDAAVSPSGAFQLASDNRDALCKRIRIGGEG